MSFFSDPRWGEALAHLPDYLGNHLRVSLTALALGLIVSLPLAIAARNRPVMRAGRLLAQGTPSELSASHDTYVGELLRTPRRQAERLSVLLPREGAA